MLARNGYRSRFRVGNRDSLLTRRYFQFAVDFIFTGDICRLHFNSSFLVLRADNAV
jgi:UDP-2,3-diacylglucosamine pyrophosphatase LpxH